MSSDTLTRFAGPAAVLGGLLWVPYGVFEMLEPWGAAKVYRDEVGYSIITNSSLFVVYSLPGTLALLFTAAGLLGVLALLGPSAGRSRAAGRILAYAALALAALSLAGLGALFDPVFTAARIFGTLALGAAAVLASLGAHRAGAGSGWTLALLALGLLGLFLLPLWPLVYAVELVPAAGGAALIGLFGLGWVGLGIALIGRGTGTVRRAASKGRSVGDEEHGMILGALQRWGGPAAVAGGVLWIMLRPLVATTWNNPTFGLTYEDYNRLMVAPLALLLLGALSLRARYAGHTSKWARRGLLATVLGLPLMLFGVVVEFYVAGGVNTGDWTGSLVGWLVFLLGYAATAVGLVVFGIAAVRGALLGRWSGLPLATGVVGLLWPFLAEVWIVLNVLIQMLFGLGWVALGLALWGGRSESYAAAAQGGRYGQGVG